MYGVLKRNINRHLFAWFCWKKQDNEWDALSKVGWADKTEDFDELKI
jgi:hypothetical protein